MMSFDYKNPTSSTIISGPVSVSRDNDTGTNFSVDSVGGYMEVYNLSNFIGRMMALIHGMCHQVFLVWEFRVCHSQQLTLVM